MRGFGTATFLRCPSSKSTIPHLLYRDPERPLPSYSSVTSMRRWIRTFPIFVLICGVSAASLFNYQKVNSPIVTANLYSLRTNRRVREVLGDEIYFASKLSWIWGTINLVQGKIDIKFDVKGTKSTGQCHFAARRVGGKGGTVRGGRNLVNHNIHLRI